MTQISLTGPWKLAEGFLIGGGLFAVGLALLLGALVLMILLRKKVYAFEWMMHGQAAVASLGLARCFFCEEILTFAFR